MRDLRAAIGAWWVLAFLAAVVGMAGASTAAVAAGERRPFPTHQAYATGSIKPSHRPQAALDREVAARYAEWKAGFLRGDCGRGQYYVWHGGYGGGGTAGATISVSEGHGYGMLIAALMAGHDPAARTIFDGLHAFFRAHPSVNHPDLMAWQQLRGCVDSRDRDSAADGDLDIAYALLLADRQWGSGGVIDYRAEAARVIAAVRAREVHPRSRLVQLGDWVDPGEPRTFEAVRSSDWMPAHYRAFAAAGGGSAWSATLAATYRLLAGAQERFAPRTGLVPDFVLDAAVRPAPAPARFLGEETGDKYGWNACRTPWRIATDFLLHGEPRARASVRRFEDFFVAATAGKPGRLRAVYTLAGKPVEDYADLAFTAPIGVGAMVDAKYQPWLNAVWDEVASSGFDRKDYYGNTLRLLSMLVMSGNGWAP